MLHSGTTLALMEICSWKGMDGGDTWARPSLSFVCVDENLKEGPLMQWMNGWESMYNDLWVEFWDLDASILCSKIPNTV